MSQFIPAADKNLSYEGRIDWHDTSAPVLVWQGTSVEVEFSGNALALCFGAGQGICFFNFEVDGDASVVRVGGATGRLEFGKLLSNGWHRLKIFKRTEAAVGVVAFRGLELADNGSVRALSGGTGRRLAFQFFGDSITAGACNEDGAADQWEDYSSHNNALSYGALVAAEFGAAYRNVAVSGMGVVIGYTPFVAAEIWNRLRADPRAAVAEDNGWAPDIVFVNYGENDDSFSRNQGVGFPAEFAERYVSLVRTIRKAYPAAELVLLRGGMWGGAKSEPLRDAWERAVRQLASEDAHLHHFIFQHWSDWHPRVSDHRAMAGELVAWLKTRQLA